MILAVWDQIHFVFVTFIRNTILTDELVVDSSIPFSPFRFATCVFFNIAFQCYAFTKNYGIRGNIPNDCNFKCIIKNSMSILYSSTGSCSYFKYIKYSLIDLVTLKYSIYIQISFWAWLYFNYKNGYEIHLYIQCNALVKFTIICQVFH